MKVGAAIYSMLKDDSAVSALVGTRIYPELAEEGASTPYVVYSVVSNTPVDTKESAPVDEAQLEVFSVADTYAAANDLADKVRAALSRQSKKVLDTVTVQSIKYTNEVTEVSAERNMYVSVQDYTARITSAPLLLDVYGGAHSAYSMRRLSLSYNGPCIRVQRSSDNALTDIGFAENSLDLTALQNFVGASDGRIRTVYDQSGNSNDLEQTVTARRPLIIDGGVLQAVDNKPAFKFDGSDDTLPFDNNGLDISSMSSFVVGKYNTTTGDQQAFTGSGSASNKRWYAPRLVGGSFQYTVGDNSAVGTATANTNNNLHTVIAGATQGDVEAFLNGTSVGTKALSSGIDAGEAGLGSRGTSAFMSGFVQEVIVYGSDQSANRTAMENSINTHYSIY